MSARGLVTANRTLSTGRALSGARAAASRISTVESVSFTENAIYRKASGTGPVGSANMTFVTALIPGARVAFTEYVISMSNATASGGYGIRSIQNAGSNVSFDCFIVNGATSIATAPTVNANIVTDYRKLLVIHCTYNGTTLSSWKNGALNGVPATTSGYTARTSGTPMAIGARGNLSGAAVARVQVIAHQVYESAVFSSGDVASHYASIVSALGLGGRCPAMPGYTLNYAWDAMDATSSGWTDYVGGTVLAVANAGYVPEKSSIPAVP